MASKNILESFASTAYFSFLYLCLNFESKYNFIIKLMVVSQLFVVRFFLFLLFVYLLLWFCVRCVSTTANSH